MNRAPDPTTIFRALKPAELDRLAEDGYSRHRDDDLARIAATSPGRSGSWHRRRVVVHLGPRLVAGLAAASVAAGVVVLVSQGHDGQRTDTRRSTTAAPSSADARTFLLASAVTAAKAPAKTGEYWYTRERTTEWTTEGYSLKGAPLKGKLRQKRQTIHLTSPATIASTEESWIGRGKHARTIVGIDTKTTIAPADLAAWRAAGPATLSMGLTAKRTVSNYNMTMHFMIGNQQVTMAELAELPTDEKRLEAELRRRYAADRRDPREKAELKAIHVRPATFAEVVWGTAQDLLAGPISPGTRAALYRVLAKQPEIKLVGPATDSLGRPGTALTLVGGPKTFVPGTGPAPTEERLIIDPQSAQLLAHESYSLDAAGRPVRRVHSDAYQAMGFTDRIDQRT